MKTAGTVAGVAAAAGFNPRSYAANEKVRLGVIGTGGQGRFHIMNGIAAAEDLEIVAVCDVFLRHQELGWKASGGEEEGRTVNRYIEYKEMIEKEELDAVLIATPLFRHYEQVMDCLDAGLHVFCEKTMTMTIEQSRKIVEKCNETGLFVQVGHQRRYNPLYNKSLALARDKNMIGRINHITAQWHRNDSWRRPVPKNYNLTPEEAKYITDMDKHINWRLYNDTSAGLMTELGTHQLDVASWFLGGIPNRVMGFGGIDYWRDGRECDDNVTLMYEWDMNRSLDGFGTLSDPRHELQKKSSLNRPYTVRMTYSSICANAKRHYSELIHGDRGSYELVGESRCQFFAEPWVGREAAAKAKALEEKAKNEGSELDTSPTLIPGEAFSEGIPLEVYVDESGSTKYEPIMANLNQWAGFAKDVKANTTPKSNQMSGLCSAICGHMGNQAIAEGKAIDIDPALFQFDFDTPDPFAYDWVEGPNPLDALKEKMANEEETSIT
jgi:predicted dehydrogenase